MVILDVKSPKIEKKRRKTDKNMPFLHRNGIPKREFNTIVTDSILIHTYYLLTIINNLDSA